MTKRKRLINHIERKLARIRDPAALRALLQLVQSLLTL